MKISYDAAVASPQGTKKDAANDSRPKIVIPSPKCEPNLKSAFIFPKWDEDRHGRKDKRRDVDPRTLPQDC